MQDIKNCFDRLTFLVNLTPQEKVAYLKLGAKTSSFIQHTLMYYKQHPNLHLSYVSLAEWENEWEVCRRLERLESMLRSLHEGVQDTIIALKQESTQKSLAFYNNAKKAATYNVPGTKNIIENLQPMLPGRKSSKKNTENQDNPG